MRVCTRRRGPCTGAREGCGMQRILASHQRLLNAHTPPKRPPCLALSGPNNSQRRRRQQQQLESLDERPLLFVLFLWRGRCAAEPTRESARARERERGRGRMGKRCGRHGGCTLKRGHEQTPVFFFSFPSSPSPSLSSPLPRILILALPPSLFPLAELGTESRRLVHRAMAGARPKQ